MPLPGNAVVRGRVTGFGRITEDTGGAGQSTDGATIPTYIRLADPAKARGYEQAPVGVDITSSAVEDALSVPVTALVGKAGGGFAVVVLRAGERKLVPVELGLFDTGGGRVQVDGDLGAGDRVAVPSL